MMRIKETLAELERYILELEQENTRCKSMVQQLLNESDVKSLPSYKLLLCKYGEQEEIEVDIAQDSEQKVPVRELVLPVVQEESIKDIVYQSIYEPPSLRYKKKPVKKPMPPAAEVPKAKPSVTAAAPPKVIKATGMLYQVELDKNNYYIHGDRLFDTSRLEAVGYITRDCFVLESGKTYPVMRDASIKSMEDYPDYWKDDQDVVYQKAGPVFHGIGTFVEGDINLWVPEGEEPVEVDESICFL